MSKFKITIVVVPDDPNATIEEIRDWAEIVARGIGTAASIEIEPNEVEAREPPA